MTRKWMTIMLALVLAFGAAACSSNAPESTGENGGPTGTDPVDVQTNESKKHNISFLGLTWGNVPPKDGRGVQMIDEKFNVNYDATLVPGSEYDDKLTTIASSGDLPDMVTLGGAGENYRKWAAQGAFLALDDYINDYPSFKNVPDFVWDQMRVNGKIYAIPRFFPFRYVQTPIIRKDWLDNLGLEMPTNYQELKQVAIAFAKEDPDRNNKNDTFGLTTSNYPYPDFAMGAYWDSFNWYHKDADGNYIPTVISEARKELLQFWADLFQEGAVSKDLAVLTGSDARKSFWSGEAGIYIAQPYDQGPQNFEALQQIHPNAELAAIPAFAAPDGSQGFTGSKGYYEMTALSGKLAKDPDKVKRILSMLDFGRTFIPIEQQNDQHPDFDWIHGNAGIGYQMVDGKAVWEWTMEGNAPKEYLPDTRMWARDDADLQVSKGYANSLLKSMAESLESMHAKQKTYVEPTNLIFSEILNSKYWELEPELMAEHMKMITGQRPLSDFDIVKQEVLDKGYQEIIEDVNKKLKEAGVGGSWQ